MVLDRTFQKWLDFLLFANNEERNIAMLLEYFSFHFSKSPELAYDFLELMKKLLQSMQDVQAQKNLAYKYLRIFSILSERFNFYQEKRELDDLCFQIYYPEAYEDLSRKLSNYEEKSHQILSQISQKITEVLKKDAYKLKLLGRFKNIYSIYQKIQKKSLEDISQMKDIFGFRVVLQSENSDICFDVLHTLHAAFTPEVDFFKDYISIPKINGYQSLHTGLKDIIPGFNSSVEVQIRTQAMHDFAQFGLAAHFLYSRKKKAKLLNEKEKKLMHHFFDTHSHFQEFLYCLSNKGDVFVIGKDAQALDFAFKIHSHVGENAKSAIINGYECPLSQRIQEGDIIQIVTQ